MIEPVQCTVAPAVFCEYPFLGHPVDCNLCLYLKNFLSEYQEGTDFDKMVPSMYQVPGTCSFHNAGCEWC